MGENCSLILDGKMKGKLNMARDWAMFDVMDGSSEPSPILRIYSWIEPTVSIGLFQKKRHLQRVNFEFVSSTDIPFVKRPTGGRAVLHDLEISYSVVFPYRFFENKSVKSTSFKIAKALRRALERIGIPSEINTANERYDETLCYISTALNEIKVEGKKLIANAQRKGKKVILQHGSIPLKLDLDLYTKIFARDESERQKLKYIMESKTVSLWDLDPHVSEKNLIEAIIMGFEEIFGLNMVETELDEEIVNLEMKIVDNLEYRDWRVCHHEHIDLR
ncbi:MAG: hypothetical protein DRP30_00420 [Thermotoga sp.]|nr:MAG: hypothetical protein DRP30_00420 [Thermotoga sp.]HDM70549.1 lipoate--protein ligase family protein [Thermotogales bacterium]